MVVGGTAFAVEVAATGGERTLGLSGRDSLPSRTGMLFVYESGRAGAFWMRGMRFPLDFIWIGSDCTVVDLTENVPHPPPDTLESELTIYKSAVPAAYVLEVNAGEVKGLGVATGDVVQFKGVDAEAARC